MQKLSFLFFIPILYLIGCSTLDKEQVSRGHKIILQKGAFLERNALFPLTFKGTFLQQIKITIQEKSYQFFMHLIISPQKLKVIAFNDLVGQIYDLTWTKENLTWFSSKHIPQHINPEVILVNFLLIYLPFDVIEKQLKGAKVRDKNKTRLIFVKEQPILRIVRSMPMNSQNIDLKKNKYLSLIDLWKNVRLKDKKLGYQLDIQTERLQ